MHLLLHLLHLLHLLLLHYHQQQHLLKTTFSSPTSIATKQQQLLMRIMLHMNHKRTK